MSASATTATYIQVEIGKDDKDVYFATSDDVDGLLVVSKDRDLLIDELIPQAIADLFLACGVKVFVTLFVTPTETIEERRAFVAMPADLAKKKLEEMEAR